MDRDSAAPMDVDPDPHYPEENEGDDKVEREKVEPEKVEPEKVESGVSKSVDPYDPSNSWRRLFDDLFYGRIRFVEPNPEKKEGDDKVEREKVESGVSKSVGQYDPLSSWRRLLDLFNDMIRIVEHNPEQYQNLLNEYHAESPIPAGIYHWPELQPFGNRIVELLNRTKFKLESGKHYSDMPWYPEFLAISQSLQVIFEKLDSIHSKISVYQSSKRKYSVYVDEENLNFRPPEMITEIVGELNELAQEASSLLLHMGHMWPIQPPQ